MRRIALVAAMSTALRQESELKLQIRSWEKKADFQPTLQVVRRDEAYTVETLEAFQVEFPDTRFVLVIGEDCIADRHSWHRWEEIPKFAELLIVSRAGYKTADGFEVRNVGGPEVSSTSIRERLAAGDLTHLIGPGADIPSQVLRQIEKRGLYGYTPKTFPPAQVSLGQVTIKVEHLKTFKPANPFALTGDVRQVLAVNMNPEGDFVFQVLWDTAMAKEHWERVLTWMRDQTEARRDGREFLRPKPTLVGPALQYLQVGDPVEGNIAKGTFLGIAGDYAFWQVEPERGLYGGLLGGLF